MSYFAGLDVSLRSVSICVIDADGKKVLERTVPFEVEDVIACLRSVDGTIEQVGFEAGVMSQHLYHGHCQGKVSLNRPALRSSHDQEPVSLFQNVD